MITLPPLSFHDRRNNPHFRVMRAEGGGMGYLNVADFTAELWRRETDCDGSWMLGGTVELEKLLPPGSDNEALRMLGYAEENNVVFFWTVVGVFMFNLQSLQLTRLSEIDISGYGYHPFETVYTPGTSMPFHCGYNKVELFLS